MRLELLAPNGDKAQIGVEFRYLVDFELTREILCSIAEGPKLFGEKEKQFRADIVGEKRDAVQCSICTIEKINGKRIGVPIAWGYAIRHTIENNKKLKGRKIAFTRALHELSKINAFCDKNGGHKEVRKKLWAEFLGKVKVLGYRKPVTEEAVAKGE